ncbi:MAG: hypothetical protein LBQ31_10210 [Bacteroidales bacterium]|jgi:C-terminal processing protease CtpA/Prc|nr:hypothetical protein [Bacteroidales bacterium]
MNKQVFSFVTIFCFSLTIAFSQPLSQDGEQRLLSFCKLYSTVKYYYPDPNLQDFSWDAFAYQGYKIASTSKNDKDFIKKTESLFRAIAPGVQISKKEFNIAHITPKDTSLYSERAFWQHRGGLNVERASFSNASTLNYIYKKPMDNYLLYQRIVANPKGLLGKKLRFSLQAKVEGNDDTVRAFSFYTAISRKEAKRMSVADLKPAAYGLECDEKGAKKANITIKVAGNEWKRYVAEMEHPDSIVFSDLVIYHPKKGTVYLDDLKLERFENESWEEIEIDNADFEGYSPSGYLGGWDVMYAFGSLVIADSINAMNGKYYLKLPAVQDKLLYPPVDINRPHTILLPIGYKAYVPLQLYADDKTVFPVSDKQTIKDFTQTLSANQLAIACIIQTWAALYHDYSYREDNFENKINRLLFQTIYKLNTAKATDFYTILVNDFLIWINDPHLRLEWRGKNNFIDESIQNKEVNIPVKRPNSICLTETQCVVANVIDDVTDLRVGDVILQINGVSIDSLLQLYKTHNISRFYQLRTLEMLMRTRVEPEINVRLLRDGKIVNVVFSTYTRQGRTNLVPLEKENREKYKALQNSLKEEDDLFYLNTMYPPETFSNFLLSGMERTPRRHATDSLITEMNQCRALILDVRGHPSGNILSYLNECMGVDLHRKTDILKTAFYPVAQFKRDTLDYVQERERKDMLIKIPVYVLIDYNTMSAPEMNLLDPIRSGRITLIGSNTAGAAGFVCKTKITDNITLVYTTGQFVGLDNNPMSYQGTGIPPDIYVYPTPQGIAEGRDEVLEKAVEIALKNIKAHNSVIPIH